MPGFNFGAFAGGIGQGMEQGLDIRQRYQQLADAKRQRDAEALAAAAQIGSLNAPPEPTDKQGPAPMVQPGMPPQGAPPMGGAPPPGGMPTPVPMPGAQPMPPMGGPPPGAAPQPAPMGGPPPMGAPQAPPPGAGGPAPAPAPQMGGPPPGAPPQAPGVQQGPKASQQQSPEAQAMGQMAQQQQQQQAILKGYYQQVVAAGGDTVKKNPLLAYEAVQKIIEQNKAIDDSQKQLLTMENALLRDKFMLARTYMQQTGADQRQDARDATSTANTDTRVAEEARGHDMAHEDRVSKLAEAWAAVKAKITSSERIAAAHDATTIQATDIRASTQEDIASKMIQFRQQALEAGLDEKEWQAQLTAALKEQGMSDAFISKLFASQASNAPAGGAPPAPSRTERPLPAPPPRRSGGGGGGVSVPPPKGPPGSQGNPVRPHTPQEARALPPGTWFMDPQGNIGQR